jgi:CRP-like cAMP-binding protein
VSLLDLMSEANRQRFESLGAPVELARGEFLIRRGESGGDVYLVRAGQLDVVDTRATPEVILASIPPGELIGELSFLDDSPRTADVRAALETRVLRWARDDIRSLLVKDPGLAREFWEGLAVAAARRARTMAEGASRLAPTEERVVDNNGGRREIRRLSDAVKTDLVRLETQLRLDPTGPDPGLAALLDRFERDLAALVEGADPECSAVDAAFLQHELNPYLVRAVTADRCLRRTQGVAGNAAVLSHAVAGLPAGDGRLGEILDRWLLDRPTFRAIRELPRAVAHRVAALVPDDRRASVVVLNAGTGTTLAAIAGALRAPMSAVVVDQSRDALAALQERLADQPMLSLETVQENLVLLANGRSKHSWAARDAVILHGVLEYLPDRLAIPLLDAVSTWLAPGGSVVATALGPSPDRLLVDRLLGWPTIRRSAAGLAQLFRASGLRAKVESEPEPLLVCVATRERSLDTWRSIS